jgi:hypothetical protein
MNVFIWLLNLFGFSSWAIAIEAKLSADKQEVQQHESKIAQEIEDEKEEVVNSPDDSLNTLLDKLRDDAQARSDSKTNSK